VYRNSLVDVESAVTMDIEYARALLVGWKRMKTTSPGLIDMFNFGS